MNAEFNLIKRFLADTPPFWKVLGLIGLLMVALSDLLFQYHLASDVTITIVATFGAAIKLASLFAQKDVQILQSATDPLDAINKITPVITDQINQIADQIAHPDKPEGQ